MSGRSAFPDGPPKRLFVTISIAGALLAWTLLGVLSTPAAQARTSSSAAPTQPERAKLLAEQAQPQKEVPFNPASFDKYVGYYQLGQSPVFFHIYRDDGRYFSQITGQQSVEVFPESATEFFATVVAAQISFVTDPEGRISELVLHQGGYLRPWRRVPQAVAEAAEAELAQRIKDNRPSPGTEMAIRRQIQEVERTHHALYTEMAAPLASAAHEQHKQVAALIEKLGPFVSIRFDRVLPNGEDDYVAMFAHGQLEITITPLGPAGKIDGLLYRKIP